MPRIGPHHFVLTGLTREPFVTTRVGNRTGVGKAVGTRSPQFLPEDFDLDASLLFVNVGFVYQAAVRDWLAVWGSFDTLGRIGTDTNSLLAQGVQASVGFDLGWLFRILQTESSILSGTVQVWNTSLTSINLRDWAFEGRELVRPLHSVRTGGGLRYAYGLSDLWGFTASGTLGFGEALDDRGDNGVFWELEAGVSANLHHRTGAPIGFAVVGHLSSFPFSGEDFEESTLVGLFRVAYTGREDFLLGVDLSFQRLRQTRYDESLKLGSLALNLTYFI